MQIGVFLVQSATFIYLLCHCASLSTAYALSQLMTWFSSTIWSVMADLWVTLLSLALEAVYQLWKSPLLSCIPWSSDRTSCLYLQHMSWSSSCKGHDRFGLLFILDLVLRMNHAQSSVASAVRWGRLAVAMPWDFRILSNILLSTFTYGTTTIRMWLHASCVLFFRCFVLQRFSHDVLFDPIDGPGNSHTYWAL